MTYWHADMTNSNNFIVELDGKIQGKHICVEANSDEGWVVLRPGYSGLKKVYGRVFIVRVRGLSRI